MTTEVIMTRRSKPRHGLVADRSWHHRNGVFPERARRWFRDRRHHPQGCRQDQRARDKTYRKLRPGDPPTVDTATQLFQGMSFDPRKYDFPRGPHEVQHQAVRSQRFHR
jgi:hypothetical protein